MEFKGNTIKGTEGISGLVYIARSGDDQDNIEIAKHKDIFETLDWEEADEIRYQVQNIINEDLRRHDFSSLEDTINIINEISENKNNEAEFVHYLMHLYILRGGKDVEVGLGDVRDFVEMAKTRICEGLKTGYLILKLIDNENITNTDSSLEELKNDGGLSPGLVLSQMKLIALERITEFYKEESSKIDRDTFNYGRDTASALAKDRSMPISRKLARTLRELNLITDSEVVNIESIYIDDEILDLQRSK